MIGENFLEKARKEFSEKELNRFAKGPIVSEMQIESGDRVILRDEFVDYLAKFFDGIYDGGKIPVTFEKVGIEIIGGPIELKFYVHFFKKYEHQDWFAIDVWINNNWAFKLLDFNQEEPQFECNGETKIYKISPILLSNVPKTAINANIDLIGKYVRNVYAYVYLYAYANMDNPEVVEVEQRTKVKTEREQVINKKGNPVLKKVKKTIPYTKRVFKFEKPTPNAEAKAKDYILSRWKVRGYTYIRNGKKITVGEHIAHRRYPNQGVDGIQRGTDYYLRKRKEE